MSMQGLKRTHAALSVAWALALAATDGRPALPPNTIVLVVQRARLTSLAAFQIKRGKDMGRPTSEQY